MRIAGCQGRDIEIYNDIKTYKDISSGNQNWQQQNNFYFIGKSSVADFLLQRLPLWNVFSAKVPRSSKVTLDVPI